MPRWPRWWAACPMSGSWGSWFDRRGDELTAILPFDDKLIGNPADPGAAWRGDGGVSGDDGDHRAELVRRSGRRWRAGGSIRATIGSGALPPLPKTIDFTVDYLRSGLPRDAYARARVNRSGRRYASVHVEAWQDNRGAAVRAGAPGIS